MTHSLTRVGIELLWQLKRYCKEKENMSLEKRNTLNEKTTTHSPPGVQVSIGLFWWMVFLGLTQFEFFFANKSSLSPFSSTSCVEVSGKKDTVREKEVI